MIRAAITKKAIPTSWDGFFYQPVKKKKTQDYF